MSEFTIILHKTKRANCFSGMSDGCEREGEFATNSHAVCIVKDGFRLSADLTERRNGNIYCEHNNDPHSTSFVMSFGWCYRHGSIVHQFEEKDMIQFLQSHRAKSIPDVNALSGIYSLLSYDHLSETLWVCTDMWAQHGFYYGSNDSKVVVSSKASIVADALNASIDGISYLSLLRDTGIPPGRTLYGDVQRVTCGRGLHLDIRSYTARLVQVQPLYRSPEKISFHEAVDQLIDVLTRVCPSAASGPSTVVDLTGGNDSRLMAAALASSQGGRIGKQVTFKVVGEEDLPDVMIARQIANEFGWTLQRISRWTEESYSAKSLLEASILSDGNHLPANVHRRRAQESRYSGSLIGHVGSIGGELFRDFFWRHEFLQMGRTSQVNFDALLKHRLYASNDVDVVRVSDGQLTLHDHNLSLLSPYQTIASAVPDLRNVYKLDIIYLHKLMGKSYCWILSDLRKLILPFMSHEVTSFSLRTPWEFRAHRKLITAAVEKISPALSAIPTDTGAPMRPLRLSSVGSYTKYTVLDFWSAYKRHFSSKTTAQKQGPSSSVPSEWLDVFDQNLVSRSGRNIPLSMKKTRVLNNDALSAAQYREIQALLLIQSLTQHYKGISPSLSFNGKNANFTDITYQL